MGRFGTERSGRARGTAGVALVAAVALLTACGGGAGSSVAPATTVTASTAASPVTVSPPPASTRPTTPSTTRRAANMPVVRKRFFAGLDGYRAVERRVLLGEAVDRTELDAVASSDVADALAAAGRRTDETLPVWEPDAIVVLDPSVQLGRATGATAIATTIDQLVATGTNAGVACVRNPLSGASGAVVAVVVVVSTFSRPSVHRLLEQPEGIEGGPGVAFTADGRRGVRCTAIGTAELVGG